jgi:hypothetical protein
MQEAFLIESLFFDSLPHVISADQRREERTRSSLMPVNDANSSMVTNPVLGLLSCLRMEANNFLAALGQGQ